MNDHGTIMGLEREAYLYCVDVYHMHGLAALRLASDELIFRAYLYALGSLRTKQAAAQAITQELYRRREQQHFSLSKGD